MKPNFLVIGAMKCATTSLTDIFSQHPQMFVSTPKEPDFFCDDAVFAHGWSWYESLFAGAEGRLAVGEGSTGYTKQKLHPDASERVAKHLPDAKLIYIVRHPIERIESHWLHLVAAGEDVPPLAQALQKWPHIVDTSLYWKQISAYRRLYPDERMLVLFVEDFAREPEVVIGRCYKFLGVDPKIAAADPATPSHVSGSKRMDGSLIRRLQQMPAARAIKNLAPGLARAIMPLFRKPLPGRPEWPAELRREVARQIKDDAAEFLRFYGQPADFWKL